MKMSKKTRRVVRHIVKAIAVLLACVAFWLTPCVYVATREVGVSLLVLAGSIAIMVMSGKMYKSATVKN